MTSNSEFTLFCLHCYKMWKFRVGEILSWNTEVTKVQKHFTRNSNLLTSKKTKPVHTVSFDWFLSGLEWILNLEFCLLKLLIFYQKLLWNIRSRLNSSTFWVFRPVFRYVWSKLKLCAQKMKILIKHI